MPIIIVMAQECPHCKLAAPSPPKIFAVLLSVVLENLYNIYYICNEYRFDLVNLLMTPAIPINMHIQWTKWEYTVIIGRDNWIIIINDFCVFCISEKWSKKSQRRIKLIVARSYKHLMYDLLSKTIIRIFYGTNVEKTNRHWAALLFTKWNY